MTFRYCFPCSQALHHSLLTWIVCALDRIGYKDETNCRTDAYSEQLCQNKWKLHSLLRFQSQLPSLYWWKTCQFISSKLQTHFRPHYLCIYCTVSYCCSCNYIVVATDKQLKHSSLWWAFIANTLWLKQYVTFGTKQHYVKHFKTKVCLLIKLCISACLEN